MNGLLPFTAGVAVGCAACVFALRRRRTAAPVASNLARLRGGVPGLTSNDGSYFNADDAPAWLRDLFTDSALRRVFMREWEDAEWRVRSGWRGADLIHDPNGRAVVVLAYFWNAQKQELTGIVRFGPDAESHRGLCHGGAMTSLMDDLCGHICFFAGPAPWCGATVQVNCKLSRPVQVGAVLKVVGTIERREAKGARAKVFIAASLLGGT